MHICLSACLHTCLPACLLAYLSACLFVSLSQCHPGGGGLGIFSMSHSVSVVLSLVPVTVRLSACLPDCLPVCLPACLPVSLSVCLSHCHPGGSGRCIRILFVSVSATLSLVPVSVCIHACLTPHSLFHPVFPSLSPCSLLSAFRLEFVSGLFWFTIDAFLSPFVHCKEQYCS